MNKLTKIYQKRRLYDRNLIIKIASLTTHDSRSFEIFLTNFPHQHGKKTQLVSYDDSLTLIHIIARHEDFVDRRCEREIATNTLERVFLAMLFIYNFLSRVFVNALNLIDEEKISRQHTEGNL